MIVDLGFSNCHVIIIKFAEDMISGQRPVQQSRIHKLPAFITSNVNSVFQDQIEIHRQTFQPCDSLIEKWAQPTLIRALWFADKDSNGMKNWIGVVGLNWCNLILFQGDDNKLCDIGDDVKEELKKFRFRKSTNSSAIVRKLHLPGSIDSAPLINSSTR